jgi:type II secretory pathway pseudopilin PulG
MAGFRPLRKARSLRPGMILVEAMLALSILTVLGLVLLKLSLNILHPRQWVLQQTLTDAYLTYERAYAERIPFENLLANNSPWPAFPTTNTTVVEIGRLPGNRAITGTVMRTRLPDAGNYPIDGGTGSVATNPAAMKLWKAQSVLTYVIGGRTYAKSRTVLRSQ